MMIQKYILENNEVVVLGLLLTHFYLKITKHLTNKLNFIFWDILFGFDISYIQNTDI